jgi:hypothetical protein
LAIAFSLWKSSGDPENERAEDINPNAKEEKRRIVREMSPWASS